ncbi:hypothetical protein [Halomonas denitrificans]|nr:hypothetical protein [Halomonas denitrificans]
MGSPRVVFVPASGPRGSGEAFRCLNLARAMHARQPDLDVHVLLDPRAGLAPDSCWTVHALEATPARAAAAVAAHLDRLRPALAIFDGSGRTDHLRRVRRGGGRVVWVSNRTSRRRRGFSPRRMRWIDLHVLVGPGRGAAPPGRIERGMLRLFGGPAILTTSAIAPTASGSNRADRGHGNGEPRQAAVFVSGGGGQVSDGRPVPELFLDAARAFHRATGAPALVILGPQYEGEAASDSDGDSEGETDDGPAGVRVVRSLPTETLGARLAEASLIVAGAGNMLSNQVLLAARPCVMTATGGHDQPARLARLAASGAVRPAALDSAVLADAAIALHRDPEARAGLVEAVRRLGVVNDTGRVADRMLGLLDG